MFEMLSGECGDYFSVEDVIDTASLWTQTCTRCDKGGDLLVCSVRDCSSAVHRKCLPSDFNHVFAVDGGYICPLCSFKHKETIKQELRKEVILTWKASADFMHNTDNDDQNRNMAQHQQDKLAPGLSLVGGATDAAYCCGYLELNDEFDNASNLERREENCSEHIDDATGRKIAIPIPATTIFAQEQCIYPNEANRIQNHQVGNVIEQERGETNGLGNDSFQCINQESTAAVPHSKSIEATIVAAETECLHPKAAQVEASPCASDKLTASILDTEVLSKHTKHTTSPECQIVDSSQRAQAHPNAVLVEAPCESEMSEASGSITEPHLLHVKCTTKHTNTGRQDVDLLNNSSYQSPRTSEIYVEAQKNETLSSEIPGKNPESSKPIDLATFIKEKRKRHLWTPLEEDMLKEGVHKFVTTATKNIPWKKILVFGGEVFKDRAPSDLKDKWKLLMKIKRKQ